METPTKLGCKWCGRNTFRTQRDLDSHILQSICGNLRDAATKPLHNGPRQLFRRSFPQANTTLLPQNIVPRPPSKAGKNFREHVDLEAHDVDELAHHITEDLAIYKASDDEDLSSNDEDDGILEEEGEIEGEDGYYASDSASENSYQPNSNGNQEPNTWIRDQFRTFCEHARQNFIAFSKEEVVAIRLLHLLKEKNAPMNAYEPVMLWHLKEAKKIWPTMGLGEYIGYFGRKTILEKLKKRYNYEDKMPKQKTIKLPVSGTIVKITCHSAEATIQRLLTDPRIDPRDYLFWDGNPLAPPPENLDFVQDLNTGQAFLDTYAEIIDPDGREQLLPVVIYTDGTAVSHFHDMEIIQVNIALGNMTREARMKPHCWAPLGYIEKIHEQGGRGREILRETNHVETQDGYDFGESGTESVEEAHGVGDKTDQDFHAMMGVILQEFVELQERGFLWDHHDPGTGVDTVGIHYKLFVPFLKVDSKEADQCCGKYGNRFNTQQVCRKCHIPLAKADDHLANYPLKTVAEIKELVDNADLPGLQALSQTYLRNAFYKIRFSSGSAQGIHGSCPSELLHAFLLGLFKYVRDIFFEVIGPTSEAARQINALAKVYGKYFARQSDRTMPGTAFSRGIQVGKLMAKDYRGVLLIILTIVRSTKGRSILQKRGSFRDQRDLDDWILLVELLLEWESYLNEPKMLKKHVKRLARKHRYIMYIMRRVAQRNKGMGLKLLKFHMILHIVEDIIELGVPLEYDTSANESMHKPSKKASKMTQRAADTFNFQTANRLVEFNLLDLAMVEIEQGRVPWDYFHRIEPPENPESVAEGQETWTGETKISVFHDEETGRLSFSMSTRSKFLDSTRWSTDIIYFLYALQDQIPAEKLQIATCHKRNGQVFRGHPNYRGKGPWKDWVMVDWAGYGELPSHIWCFVILENMPEGRNTIHYGGIPLKDGVFAVVETTILEEDNEIYGQSDLMTPYLKNEIVVNESGSVTDRTFYLADTEAFLDPCCMIPDLGGPSNRYFRVLPRNQWAKKFTEWVEANHSYDTMEDLEEGVENDNSMSESSEEDE